MGILGECLADFLIGFERVGFLVIRLDTREVFGIVFGFACNLEIIGCLINLLDSFITHRIKIKFRA
jgi:hypothetical protein